MRIILLIVLTGLLLWGPSSALADASEGRRPIEASESWLPSLKVNKSAGTLTLRSEVVDPVAPVVEVTEAKSAFKPAPTFSGKTSEGHALSLVTLSATKPVILYFIEKACPCSRDAAIYFERLQALHGKEVTVVGVINSDATEARIWAASAKVTFSILLDEECEVIHAYKVERSVSSTIISPGGGLVKVYSGYSAQTLDDTSDQLAKLLNKSVRRISTEGAPTKLTVGCTFPQ